jgi:hypothetical protein
VDPAELQREIAATDAKFANIGALREAADRGGGHAEGNAH